MENLIRASRYLTPHDIGAFVTKVIPTQPNHNPDFSYVGQLYRLIDVLPDNRYILEMLSDDFSSLIEDIPIDYPFTQGWINLNELTTNQIDLITILQMISGYARQNRIIQAAAPVQMVRGMPRRTMMGKRMNRGQLPM